ncbi:PAS domain-containing protein [Roseobacter sp.]|uniref:PAS domain-containing protein n=1 Tax=Roseobacter sp. TaxID=1907202 RepID=UPI00385AE525
MQKLPDDAPDVLVALYNAWQAIRVSRPPTKADFPFEKVAREHPGLFWVERTDATQHDVDFRFIAVGSEVGKRNGRKLVGTAYSEVMNERTLNRVARVFPQQLARGEPHYWDIITTDYGEEPVQYQRVLLPLFDDNGTAVSLLGSCVWKDHKAQSD